MCMGVGVQGETWLARHAHVLQAVEKARSGGDVAKALLFVERMLVEQAMMQPQWEPHFQPAWRHSLAKCSDSRQAILYLAALQVRPSQTTQTSLLVFLPHGHDFGCLHRHLLAAAASTLARCSSCRLCRTVPAG